MNHEFYATCPKGFEQLLAGELRQLKYVERIRPLIGQVRFEGEMAAGLEVCLWSRLASRVVLVLASSLPAATSDELYASMGSIDWSEHFSHTQTFAIDAHGTNAGLTNSQFVALRAKDAIVDQFARKVSARPSVDTHNPDVRIALRVRQNQLSVGIDFSGTPLFMRGYEPAPHMRDKRLPFLRPDYAAALLEIGGWSNLCTSARAQLAALFPGAGTIFVEAAARVHHQAPGLLRAAWGFSSWLQHDEAAWSELLAEARYMRDEFREAAVELNCLTTDKRSISSTSAMLRSAGLSDSITSVASLDNAALVCADLSWCSLNDIARESLAISELIHAVDSMPSCAHLSLLQMGATDILLLARNQEATEKTSVMVGRDEALLTSYVLPEQTTCSASAACSASATSSASTTIALPDSTTLTTILPASDQFAARLSKVAKVRRKWSQREDISCYRIYDADLPDYAVAIDLFEGKRIREIAGKGEHIGADEIWLSIAEYAAPKEIDATRARLRLMDVMSITSHVLGVDPHHIVVRTRTKARGGSQYANVAKSSAKSSAQSAYENKLLVDEGGLAFELNFSSGIDFGLFLDHRDTRARIREMAKTWAGTGSFLNLFAYTGSATCYAADSGMKYTTTVDLSKTYLTWAKRNMKRNGFEGREHEFIQADVLQWIQEQRHTNHRWNLIFCDPPTFSNSARMRKRSFDIQRDHAEMLIGISRLLTRDGVCIFSCNLRNFKPDVEALAKAGVSIEDITQETIPADFERNRKIHHCYIVKRS